MKILNFKESCYQNMKFFSYHATSRDGCQSSIFKVLNFEHDSHIGRQWQSFTIWQSQKSIVIQDRVNIFDPFWVNISVKYDPKIIQEILSKEFMQLENNNGILFPKLFWPTLRKKMFYWWRKSFEVQGWRSRIWKRLRSLEQFIWTVKGQYNFWNRM